MTRRLLALLAAALGVAVWAGSAYAARVDAAVSSNWAGYAVAGADPTAVLAFSTVAGSWIQPAATCTAGSPAYSAFWVGLGGSASESAGLEQIGTEANCSAAGRVSYSAWYELVPAGPVSLKFVIRAGDAVSARVTVAGSAVAVQLRNLTRHTVLTRRLTTATPDVSSAEWIAEAPSACSRQGGFCRALPLANFGTLAFTSATAAAAGHTGTISDPAWAATAVTLQSDGGFDPRSRFGGLAASGGATPSPLSADGASFTVAWAQSAPPQQPVAGGFPA